MLCKVVGSPKLVTSSLKTKPIFLIEMGTHSGDNNDNDNGDYKFGNSLRKWHSKCEMCVELYARRLWLFLGAVSCTFAIPGMVLSSSSMFLKRDHPFIMRAGISLVWVHYIIQLYVDVVCRHMRRPPIGRFRKSAIEVVTVCAALTLRETMRNDVHHLISLITITLDLHVFAQLFKATLDIGLLDVLLGLFMQVLVYETSKEIYVTIAVTALCGFVIIYRCWSYSPPFEPFNESKKLDGDGAQGRRDRRASGAC